MDGHTRPITRFTTGIAQVVNNESKILPMNMQNESSRESVVKGSIRVDKSCRYKRQESNGYNSLCLPVICVGAPTRV